MQFFVKTDRTRAVQLPPHATLDTLREILQQNGHLVDVDDHYFVMDSRVLEEDSSLTELGVEDDCTIEVHGRLLGGGKKRKKKTYTKPKKPQHKRQHEKLRALKMYKVEGQKVIRCKKECPRCGPGVFMATHFDRVYCGKCTMTYLYEGGEDNE